MKLSNIFKKASPSPAAQDRLKLQKIRDWCDKMKIQNAEITKDFVINVDSLITTITPNGVEKENGEYFIPHKFGEITGSFNFNLSDTNKKLRSLRNGPFKVTENYHAPSLKLKTLEGGPKIVGNAFFINNNELTDWTNFPEQAKRIFAARNKITSFTGISKYVKICNILQVDQAVNKGVLELLKIKNLETLKYSNIGLTDDIDAAEKIINHHLNNGRNPIDMQSDFLDAGLESWL